MPYITQFVSGAGAGANPWVFALAVGVAIALLTVAAMLAVRGLINPLRRRLRTVAPLPSAGSSTSFRGVLQRVAPFMPYVMPKKEVERTKIRVLLLQAGYTSEDALATFFAIKIASGIVLVLLVLGAASLYPRFTGGQVLFAALAAGFVGLVLPNRILAWRIERRQREIVNGFPDALDLIVACTEAGLGLNAALQRVANELALSYPQLSEELALVNSEMRAGVERVTALKNLATRTGVEDIRGLVSLLSQNMRFGTSIADTLRIYSIELRDKRMQRAEEAAAKIGTKMIFPLVFCMFPAFFVVMVGPAVLGVLQVLRTL